VGNRPIVINLRRLKDCDSFLLFRSPKALKVPSRHHVEVRVKPAGYICEATIEKEALIYISLLLLLAVLRKTKLSRNPLSSFGDPASNLTHCHRCLRQLALGPVAVQQNAMFYAYQWSGTWQRCPENAKMHSTIVHQFRISLLMIKIIGNKELRCHHLIKSFRS